MATKKAATPAAQDAEQIGQQIPPTLDAQYTAAWAAACAEYGTLVAAQGDVVAELVHRHQDARARQRAAAERGDLPAVERLNGELAALATAHRDAAAKLRAMEAPQARESFLASHPELERLRNAMRAQAASPWAEFEAAQARLAGLLTHEILAAAARVAASARALMLPCPPHALAIANLRGISTTNGEIHVQ